ncbi:MAG: HPr family phosphocarrier protein [Planctomycetota bacterium]
MIDVGGQVWWKQQKQQKQMASHRSSQPVTVLNPQGLHLRAADMIVRAAKQFESKIAIVQDEEQFDGKSILSLLTLGAEQGTQLLVEAKGPDAEKAVATVVGLFGRGFDELPVSEAAKDSRPKG